MKILIAIPAYNEAKMLRSTVSTLVNYCQQLPDEYQIIIANNNSTDQTGEIAQELAANHDMVSTVLIKEQGKGAAVFGAWNAADADVFCFMDADLATDLKSLPLLIDALRIGADIAIGSRFHSESIVERSLLRKTTSWLYRLLLKVIFSLPIADAPCGFKAVNKKVTSELVPTIIDRGWFFDSELLIRAARAGYSITEVPVTWIERRSQDDPSRVHIARLGRAYISKVLALKKKLNEGL